MKFCKYTKDSCSYSIKYFLEPIQLSFIFRGLQVFFKSNEIRTQVYKFFV